MSRLRSGFKTLIQRPSAPSTLLPLTPYPLPLPPTPYPSNFAVASATNSRFSTLLEAFWGKLSHHSTWRGTL